LFHFVKENILMKQNPSGTKEPLSVWIPSGSRQVGDQFSYTKSYIVLAEGRKLFFSSFEESRGRRPRLSIMYPD
jgi:hypothetical protein